jgi:hypothetical protein
MYISYETRIDILLYSSWFIYEYQAQLPKSQQINA